MIFMPKPPVRYLLLDINDVTNVCGSIRSDELCRLQKIRDYAQEIFNTLICLGYIAENKHSKKITAMTTEIKAIEDDAVENIRKMIEGE